MTTEEFAPLATEKPSARKDPAARTGPNWGRWAGAFALIAFFGLFIAFARTEVHPRVANPNVEGRPRPVEFLFGFDGWLWVHQIGTVVLLVVLVVIFVRGWRRDPGSPIMLMFLCTTLIVWQDPIMNWAPFAVYNPELIHWPENWPLIMLSPTVEPFIVFGYVAFYFAPFFPAIWILRKWQAKYGPTAFVSRHPLISLGLLVLVIGFIFDAILEVSLVRTGLYIYSQAIPFGTLFPGTTFQFPLIWESLAVTFVMIPAAILCYRDDTGKSVAEKLAARAKLFPKKPVLGTFLVMFTIINVAYFAYGSWFAAIKASGLATAVACPWPYPEAKVYDPQGYFEKEGAQGPFSVGKWATWQSGLPNGRPDVEPPPPGEGKCAPENQDG
ncbi:spirocyclase AveC family protein [[Mycobacterium] wendilense]|uniref:Spirocyclase AveC family protein n=1 Tax=[Mycobacterium] wendilense TaxID=3064284 RepID=A0ABN9P4J0_9MYCO|nr:spirocyclase AveC family protein [Mycolicibacterium sp. MU0050]CAJ1586946.1 spirocyclase AveC family protein [Mycolicibacterium sp. MU0050]